MPGEHTIPGFRISVNGAPVPDSLMVLRILVERSAHAADRVTIVIALGGGDDPFSIVDSATFAFASDLKVELGWLDDNAFVRTFSGEIVALEVRAEDDGMRPELVVTGLDLSHRLAHVVKTRTFLKTTTSQIARTIASESGLRADVVTTSVTHEYLLQDGSNHAFLSQMAQREDLRWWVDDKTLHLKPWTATGPASIKAVWGEDLITFRARGSMVDVRNAASVRGWDPDRQQAVSGRVAVGKLDDGVVIGDGSAHLAGKVLKGAKALGASEDHRSAASVLSIKEAELVAADHRARAVDEGVVVEGEIHGSAALAPGGTITVGGVGSTLSSDYRLTEVVHEVSGGGFRTRFVADGRLGRTLVDLLGADEPTTASSTSATGVAYGIVTNVKDPEGLNRVKVRLPWLHPNEGTEIETDWARVLSPHAGGSRGFETLPHVNDEVAVIFEHGDLHRPLVIGGLWSKRNKGPAGTPIVNPSSGVVERQRLTTRVGHVIELVDAAGKEAITITYKDGKTRVNIDKEGVAIEAPTGRVLVDAQSKIDVKSKGPVSVEAAQVTIKATGRLALEGAAVSIKATGSLELQGATAKLAGQGTTSVESNGITLVKGSLLKLN
jgi:phage protein D/phage baseplate assembly protein gpV